MCSSANKVLSVNCNNIIWVIHFIYIQTSLLECTVTFLTVGRGAPPLPPWPPPLPPWPPSFPPLPRFPPLPTLLCVAFASSKQ
uniref:Uncharacterized protein n=1 Tax=Amphimedon queenslandica TaxID=400682 RepID=A0A1X7VC61_AMPQE